MGADKRRSCGSLCWYPVTHNLSHLACSLPRQLRSDFSCLATARQQKSRLADTSKPFAIFRNYMGYRVLVALDIALELLDDKILLRQGGFDQVADGNYA